LIGPEALLFDTQVVITWADGSAPDGIKGRVLSGCRVYVSIVSLWEFLLKSRFHDVGLSFAELRSVIQDLDAILLPIHPQHLETLEKLPYVGNHKDPFDRLIISQAISEGYALVGSDRAFPKYGKTNLGSKLTVFWD
jgi:PIN domain nuclease of toxin-antitoxin system